MTTLEPLEENILLKYIIDFEDSLDIKYVHVKKSVEEEVESILVNISSDSP